MYPPLIVDRKDPKWLLLEQVLSITTSRRTKQELAKHGITPVSKARTVMRILLMSMFFVVDCAYVIEDQDNYLAVRSLIEDVFKLAKNAFSLRKFHRYTTRSVKKAGCLNVLLVGLVVSLGFRSKKQLQSLAEC